MQEQDHGEKSPVVLAASTTNVQLQTVNIGGIISKSQSQAESTLIENMNMMKITFSC